MKKEITVIATIVVLGIAWWLISPLWRNISLNEALPGTNQPETSGTNTPKTIENTTIEAVPRTIQDQLDAMDEKTKEEFVKKTEEMKDVKMMGEEMMPADAPKILSEAPMVARAHDVEGKAFIVQSGNQTFLRFENLKTINGPDLLIYLSADLGSKDFIDLGKIRATEGNVNYFIPEGTDLLKYRNALIWCRAFSVLFSYAEL